MAKNKAPDKLAQESTMAIAAGMSYGKWKAMQEPVKIPKRDPYADLPPEKKRSTCAWCGKSFIQSRNGKQIYCELYCQRMANYERKRQRILERRAKNAEA